MNGNELNLWVNNRISDLEQHNYKLSVMNIINKLNDCKYFVCKQRNGVNYNCGSILYGNFIITWDTYERTVSIHHNKYHTYGVAKCKWNDKFDLKTGIAIAWAKYNHEVIPDWTDPISREKLVNGDKFISSMNKNAIYTFIGWLPNMKIGPYGKWAVVLDEEHKVCRTQIPCAVIKRE